MTAKAKPREQGRALERATATVRVRDPARARAKAARAARAGKAAAKAAAKPAAEPKPAKSAKAEPAAAPAAVAEVQPEVLNAPRGDGADDLKLIGGVGPKLEGVLNELGFWHFDQIAKWTEAEVAWVDSRLKFKGRIARDGWIDQAKTLAAGGETEFSRKKKGK